MEMYQIENKMTNRNVQTVRVLIGQKPTNGPARILDYLIEPLVFI